MFNDPKILLLDALPFLRHFDSVLGFGLKSAKQDTDKVLAFIKEVAWLDFCDVKSVVVNDESCRSSIDIRRLSTTTKNRRIILTASFTRCTAEKRRELWVGSIIV